MNIKEYIESGKLEAFALGELSAEESAEVERDIVLYPELKKELEAIELAQEAFLMKAAIQPGPQVKSKLFKRIPGKEGRIISMEPQKPDIRRWRFAAAASILLALVSSFLAYNYYNRWKNTESNLNELIAQNQRIAKDYNSVNQRLDQIQRDLKIIDNPSFKRVVMNGTANAPDAMAYVYWNKKTQEVYLSIQKLAQLSAENQYQLWAIVDGKPQDAGVFDADPSGLIIMKPTGNDVVTFAVTIEPKGGSPGPTLESLQVVGQVDKG